MLTKKTSKVRMLTINGEVATYDQIALVINAINHRDQMSISYSLHSYWEKKWLEEWQR